MQGLGLEALGSDSREGYVRPPSEKTEMISSAQPQPTMIISSAMNQSLKDALTPKTLSKAAISRVYVTKQRLEIKELISGGWVPAAVASMSTQVQYASTSTTAAMKLAR